MRTFAEQLNPQIGDVVTGVAPPGMRDDPIVTGVVTSLLSGGTPGGAVRIRVGSASGRGAEELLGTEIVIPVLSLREGCMNIDAMVEAVSNGADPRSVLHSRPKQEVRGLDERDLLDEIVLVAENDGRAFAAGKDARLAVTNAISDLEKEFKSTLRQIEPKAIQMVTASWRDA